MRAALAYIRAGANPLAVIAFTILGAAIALINLPRSMTLSDWLEALD